MRGGSHVRCGNYSGKATRGRRAFAVLILRSSELRCVMPAVKEAHTEEGPAVNIPVAGRVPLPPRQNMIYYAGLGARKSTRLNSSHLGISYAVFCLKKKNPTK